MRAAKYWLLGSQGDLCPVTSSWITSIRQPAGTRGAAAEAISTLHLAAEGDDRVGRRTRHSLLEALVRPGLVVVIEELDEHVSPLHLVGQLEIGVPRLL